MCPRGLGRGRNTAPKVEEETQAPQGEEETQAPQVISDFIVVNSTDDAGTGTLRHALSDAENGDTIIFDPNVFPPNTPTNIYLTSGLPAITQGDLTIDASDSGVILDGSDAQGEWVVGITVNSDGNTIYGLQIVNFSGAGIMIEGSKNTIGGDRKQGNGPIGYGNMISNNADGIGIMGINTTENKIIGNLIGTNVSGEKDWGNQNPGIFIDNGANSNTIGPYNIIAYNQYGIEIRDPQSFSNTITKNRIYNNKLEGIWIQINIENSVPTPVILEYNLAEGTISGVSISNCTVEVFSDEDKEGRVFEEQVQTDDNGTFTLSKGSSFSGPHLTATATDVNGSTSRFSTPTSGSSRILVLQEGNTQPKYLLQYRPSMQLDDNKIGGLWSGFWALDMNEIIDTQILSLGLKRVRLAIDNCSADAIDWDRPELTIDPKDDDIITRLAENGIAMTYILTFWDKETWPGGQWPDVPRFKNEDEIQRYLDYVRFVVNHFKDRIQYYEIWNEQDVICEESNPEVCIQAIEVDDYINLVRRAVPVIHEEYPEVKIVVGSTCNLRFPHSYEYFFNILQSDIMPMVDAICWHGMYGTSPEVDYYRDYYYSYPSMVQEIKDEATIYGFDGEYICDEMVWRTEETPFEGEPWTYSERIATKYCARGIIINLGIDVAVTMAVNSMQPTYFAMQQNLCNVMAGAEPEDLAFDIQCEADPIASYGFYLPNGEKLLAIWTDGVATEEDAGVEATISIPGFSSGTVAAIDIINSCQQELIVTSEEGNIVIENLQVKDYPIILRLTP